MPIRIVTDSACDLPEPACEELGINVVPLTIRFGEREYVDRKELSTEGFWRELQASSVLPETAAPSAGAVEPAGRVRTRSKALRLIVDRIPEGQVEAISVLHGMAPDLDEFLALLEPKVPDAEVVVGMIGPVIGVHTGPRVIGVAFIQ